MGVEGKLGVSKRERGEAGRGDVRGLRIVLDVYAGCLKATPSDERGRTRFRSSVQLQRVKDRKINSRSSAQVYLYFRYSLS